MGSAHAPRAANDAFVVGIVRRRLAPFVRGAALLFGARARRTTREARALPIANEIQSVELK
jgi:hypothetical protein